MLSAKLKAAVDKGIVRCDVPYIHALIRRAHVVRGSVLQLDVLQAESFLKFRKQAIASILKMQAMHRGNVSRKVAKKVRSARRRESQRVEATLRQSCALARQIVPECVAHGVKSALSQLSSISHKVALNLSGVLTVVTIKATARQAKRSPVLCSSCTTRLHRGNRRKNYPKVPPTGDNLETVDVKCRAPLDFMQNGIITYRAVSGIHVERDVCTCVWTHSEEHWLLTFFEPLTGSVTKKTVSMSEIQKNIQEVVLARSNMYEKMSERKKRLQGTSYGNLEPLFFDSGVAFDGRLDKSYTYARRVAARINSILPLLPQVGGKIITNEVLYAIRDRKSLPVDSIRSTRIGQCTPTLETRTHMDRLELSRPLPEGTPNVFEPLADVLYALRHIRRVKHHRASLQEILQSRKDVLRQREEEISLFMRSKSEKIPMQYEDARSRFLRTDAQLVVAREKIVKVMGYHKENMEAYEAQEQNIQEDWKQDYDGLENGSAWRGLNESRRLEEKWHADKEEYHRYCIQCPDLVPVQKEMERKVELARAEVKRAEKAILNYTPVLAAVESIYERVHELTRTTIAASLAPWAMPRKVRGPINSLGFYQKRRLQKMRYDQVFVRDPAKRALPENIGLLDLLDRRVMALRPVKNVSGTRTVLRCIVEVFQDPCTRNVLVRLIQDESPMEENIMHIDMGLRKEELSTLTSGTLETDLLLRPNDVKAILAKPPNWPAVHLKKEVINFKHMSGFVKADLAQQILDKEEEEKRRKAALEAAAGDRSVDEMKADLMDSINAPLPLGSPTGSRANSKNRIQEEGAHLARAVIEVVLREELKKRRVQGVVPVIVRVRQGAREGVYQVLKVQIAS